MITAPANLGAQLHQAGMWYAFSRHPALTVVSASVIPMHKAMRAVTTCHPGLRGINRNTVMRILNLLSVPESLK